MRFPAIRCCFIILLIWLPMQAMAWNWRTKISLHVKNKTLSEVCRLLEQRYDIHFSYSRDILQMEQVVSIDVDHVPLKKVVERIFESKGITCKKVGDQIVLSAYRSTHRTINGYVQDLRTGEKLIGATVAVPRFKSGTVTNEYGFYSITLPKDTCSLLISFIGYEQQQLKLQETDKNKQLTFQLNPSNTLKEVEVTDDGIPLQEQTQMSKVGIALKEVKAMPKLLGESDVIRTIQSLPGISAGGDGASSLHVRGGSPDQNLVLMDGTPVYNSTHIFGIFSVFNPALIKNVDLYKGAFPARYGGRLSSVVDIAMKDGDMKKYHGEVSIGFLAAKFMVEGPIFKNKTSFVITGRRTYADLIAGPVFADQLDLGEGGRLFAYFYDANIKINHIFSPKDRMYLSAYGGQDNFRMRKRPLLENPKDYDEQLDFQLGWGNQVYSLRWNHIFNPKLFSNVSTGYSQYFFLTDYSYLFNTKDSSEVDDWYGKYFSKIHDGTFKVDFDYRPSPRHSARFGLHAITHIFEPGITQFRNKSRTETPTLDTTYNKEYTTSLELMLYGEDDWKLTDSLYVNVGLHASTFMVFPKTYVSLQPRIGMRYVLPRNWAMKLSYTHMAQYIHLLTNSTNYLPTDLWVPSTDKVRPMTSKQAAFGLGKTSNNKTWEMSAEVYYKSMRNVIEYVDNYDNFQSATKQWDEKVIMGDGWSYGTELLIQKKKGSFTGWIGYTWAHSQRRFPNVNNGEAFPYKYDRRHDLEVTLMKKFKKHWEIAASWEYTSGLPLTLPTSSYESIDNGSPFDPPPLETGKPVDYVNQRYNLRMKEMHRLDLSFTYSWQRRRVKNAFNLSLYNAYNRRNPYFYYYSYNKDSGKRELTEFSILPVLPSLTYTLSF